MHILVVETEVIAGNALLPRALTVSCFLYVQKFDITSKCVPSPDSVCRAARRQQYSRRLTPATSSNMMKKCLDLPHSAGILSTSNIMEPSSRPIGETIRREISAQTLVPGVAAVSKYVIPLCKVRGSVTECNNRDCIQESKYCAHLWGSVCPKSQKKGPTTPEQMKFEVRNRV